ncbi:MAG TPA: UbiA family prenyltransferase, partial [Candidatus Saccharimonadales bacterium]|nr:UbiA family prenyltransferase [Candidatus Saccharimonadales bacterium]
MKFKAVLKLTRIEHSIMLVIAVLAAELIAKGLPSLPILVLSLIAPVFISMAAFAINDYFDLKVDKINKKMRP